MSVRRSGLDLTPPRRHHPDALTTERFVEAAIELVEERGTDALTMRALAERLDVAVGTAYRHVADKETLLHLVADSILEQVVIPTEGSWYERLVGFQIDVLSTLKRYPGASVYVFNQSRSTRQSDITRAALSALLVEGGLSEDRVDQAVLAITTVVAGSLTVLPLRSDEQREELFRFTLDTILRGLGLCEAN